MMLFISFKSFSADAKRSTDLFIMDKKSHKIEILELTLITTLNLGPTHWIDKSGKKKCEGKIFTLKNDYGIKDFKCIYFEQLIENIIITSKNNSGYLKHGIALVDTKDALIGVIIYYGSDDRAIISSGRIKQDEIINLYGNFPQWKDIPVISYFRNNENEQILIKNNFPTKGDMLKVKIANVGLLKSPNEDSEVIIKLSKLDDLIYLGVTEKGFLKVRTENGIGWVEQILIIKIKD